MFPGYELFVYLLVNCLLVSIFVVLRYECMDAKENTFKTSYCLSDSHMRTLLSAILTVITYSLCAAIFDFVRYLRVMTLKAGVDEGVYITLATSNPLYFARACLTRWFLIIYMVAAFNSGQLFIQPLANLGIKTVNVYVKTKSTATIFNHESLYNGSTGAFPTDVQYFFPSMLSVLNTYSASSNSIYGMGGDGIILKGRIGPTTNIIRNGYVVEQYIKMSNPSNSFQDTEVIGVLTTACNPGTPVPFGNTFSFAEEDGASQGQRYIMKYDILAPNEANFTTAFAIGDIDSSSYASAECFSRLVIQQYDLIYTVNTGTVQAVRFLTNVTTVNLTQLLPITQQYAESIESAGSLSDNIYFQVAVNTVFLKFGPGLFEFPASNICHSRLSGAVSLALQYLWDASLNYKTDTVVVPLSSKVQVTYMSTLDLWLIAGSILIFTFAVSISGIACSLRCPPELRVKGFNENAMVDIIDKNTYVWERMNQSLIPNSNRARLQDVFGNRISYKNGRVGY